MVAIATVSDTWDQELLPTLTLWIEPFATLPPTTLDLQIFHRSNHSVRSTSPVKSVPATRRFHVGRAPMAESAVK